MKNEKTIDILAVCVLASIFIFGAYGIITEGKTSGTITQNQKDAMDWKNEYLNTDPPYLFGYIVNKTILFPYTENDSCIYVIEMNTLPYNDTLELEVIKLNDCYKDFIYKPFFDNVIVPMRDEISENELIVMNFYIAGVNGDYYRKVKGVFRFQDIFDMFPVFVGNEK